MSSLYKIRKCLWSNRKYGVLSIAENSWAPAFKCFITSSNQNTYLVFQVLRHLRRAKDDAIRYRKNEKVQHTSICNFGEISLLWILVSLELTRTFWVDKKIVGTIADLSSWTYWTCKVPHRLLLKVLIIFLYFRNFCQLSTWNYTKLHLLRILDNVRTKTLCYSCFYC